MPGSNEKAMNDSSILSKNSKKRKLSTGENEQSIEKSSELNVLDPHDQKILQVKKLIKNRDEARLNLDFTKADIMGEKLLEMGVFVQDQKNGPSGWRFLDGSRKKIKNSSQANTKSFKPEEISSRVSGIASSSVSADQQRNKNVLASVLKSTNNEVGGNEMVKQGVIIKEIKIGDGAIASSGNRIKVNYVGRLKSNNKVFDASKRPFSFRLGRSEVIQGWDIGVAGMKVGGKRTLTIPPEKAYGRSGSPPVIPGNATLIFDVSLIEVK